MLPLLTGEGKSHHGDILREATRLAETGMIMPQVDPRNFSLASVAEAHAVLEHHQAAGKLVIDIAK